VSRFQFVADHRDTFEVKWLCAVMEIARSSFYGWWAAAGGRDARAAADEVLAGRIRVVHTEENTYGAPRITAELNDGVPDAERVNHKRVARVMRAVGIAGYRRRRRVKTTVPDPANQKVPDLLKRDFTAEQVNTRYVGDITYLPLATGSNLYLATVIDCCSRRVTGWAIAEHMRTELVEDALKAADALRGGLAGAIFHSDHGSQYTSKDFAQLCKNWRSPNPWERSERVPIARWPSRSTPHSNAKFCRTVAAGPTRRPAAARSSDGWPATTPNGATPTAVIPAPPPTKGP
jgi:transposase InsO family protein